MEIKGRLLNKLPAEQKTDKFKIQEFYLDCSIFDQYTGERRENILKFQCLNSSIDKLDTIEHGDFIKVSFFPQGRFYKDKDGVDKHIQNFNAYGFEIVSKSEKKEIHQPVNHQQNETDSLPF